MKCLKQKCGKFATSNTKKLLSYRLAAFYLMCMYWSEKGNNLVKPVLQFAPMVEINYHSSLSFAVAYRFLSHRY